MAVKRSINYLISAVIILTVSGCTIIRGRDSQVAGNDLYESKTTPLDFDHIAVQAAVEEIIAPPNRMTMIQALDRRKLYHHHFVRIFRAHDVPDSLIDLAFVESRYKTDSHNRSSGALGIWQLMPRTARSLGLRVDRKVDERRHPIRSADAAARYLRQLYDSLGDWHLALAAYNGGEGTIRKAIKKNGGHRDFWAIMKAKLVPYETAKFVPRVLAANLVAANPDKYLNVV